MADDWGSLVLQQEQNLVQKVETLKLQSRCQSQLTQQTNLTASCASQQAKVMATSQVTAATLSTPPSSSPVSIDASSSQVTSTTSSSQVTSTMLSSQVTSTTSSSQVTSTLSSSQVTSTTSSSQVTSTTSSSLVKDTPPVSASQFNATTSQTSKEETGVSSTQHNRTLLPKTVLHSVDTGSADCASRQISPESAATSNGDELQDDKCERKEDKSLLMKLLHAKLVCTHTDIEVLRKDPSSPLHSVKSFDSLHLKPELLKGVYGMGFNSPSKIQETALPVLLADPPMNMIAQSQSGTGKTAAFVLTMLSRVNVNLHHPQCLCLAPTYELAMQIGDVVKRMSAHMPELAMCYAVRGMLVRRDDTLTEHIVIGTPGTVMDWALRKSILALDRIKVFVLDEADVMISLQGHQDQSLRIQKKLRKDCQMLLFSATYESSVLDFARKVIPNDPVVIRLRRDEQSLDNIKQYYVKCRDLDDKYHAICNVYSAISIGQSMIFCHKRTTASWLAVRMSEDHHAVALLSGELSIEQRADIIARFRDGMEKVLITTNISARGIDVAMVTLVVNFDLPVTYQNQPDFDTYLHRIGRTGRFGKSGIAVNMVDGESSMRVLQQIERHFGRRIERLNTDDFDEIEKISKD